MILMMRINLSLAVLLLNTMQVLAIIKETISYDAKGQVIRYIYCSELLKAQKVKLLRKVMEEDSEVVKCWRYTWLGAETESTNITSNCLDFETEEGPDR